MSHIVVSEPAQVLANPPKHTRSHGTATALVGNDHGQTTNQRRQRDVVGAMPRASHETKVCVQELSDGLVRLVAEGGHGLGLGDREEFEAEALEHLDLGHSDGGFMEAGIVVRCVGNDLDRWPDIIPRGDLSYLSWRTISGLVGLVFPSDGHLIVVADDPSFFWP